MLLPIRILGDPVLREPAKPVESFDRALRQLAKDMIETMYEAPGVGLAGPQVGISLQLFVFDDGEHGPPFVANPELLDADGEVTQEEGCLSIPGPYHPTTPLATDPVPGARRPREAAGPCRRRVAGAHLPARDRPPPRDALHRSPR